MFCYIKYSESAIVPLQRFGVERQSKSPVRHKIQFAPVIDRVLLTLTTSSLSEVDLPPRTHTSQLALQKSFEMINKYLSHEAEPFTFGGQSGSVVQENNPSLEEITTVVKARESVEGFRRKSFRRRSKLVPFKSPKSQRRTQLDQEQDEPNTSLMINPDCFLQIIMDYIYFHLNIEKASGILLDLCDEHGNMLRLFNYNKCESGVNIFKDRKTYYVVQYTLNDDSSFKSVEPLFRRSTGEEAELYGKIFQAMNKHKSIQLVGMKGKNLKLSNLTLSSRKSSMSNDQ